MVERVHYRRKLHYNTKRNRYVLVRTPGGRLSMHYLKKRVRGPCTPRYLGHKRLPGTKCLRVVDAKNRTKRWKTVNRCYGGVLNHAQVRDRIVQAFLKEEKKIAKRMEQKSSTA